MSHLWESARGLDCAGLKEPGGMAVAHSSVREHAGGLGDGGQHMAQGQGQAAAAC